MLFSAADAATHFQNIVALNVVHSCYSLSSARIMKKVQKTSFARLSPLAKGRIVGMRESGKKRAVMKCIFSPMISRSHPGHIQVSSRATSRAHPGLVKHSKTCMPKELSYLNLIKMSFQQGP